MDKTPSEPITLDPEQQKIVKAPAEISILVNAYAGTGKTRVLTERIVHLINEERINPENILAITFTNKSAEEMKKRIHNRIADSRKIPHNVYTIDAIFGQILRENIQDLNIEWSSNFQNMDEEKMHQLMINSGNEHHKSRVSNQNRTQMTNVTKIYAEIRDKLWHGKNNIDKEDLASFKAYEKKLKDQQLLDFDAIIFYAKVLLRDNEKIRDKGIKKYQYIFVDEIQDLNIYRGELISLLLREGHTRFLGIGDPNQAIYLYDGDVVEKIFTEVPEKINIHMSAKLTTNYRSSPKIIEFSSQYRRHSHEVVKAHIEEKQEHQIKNISDLDELITLIKNGKNYSDWAILYRSNKMSEKIWGQLIDNEIHFQISKFKILKSEKDVSFLTNAMKIAFFDNRELANEIIGKWSESKLIPLEFSETMKNVLRKNNRTFLRSIFENVDECKAILEKLKGTSDYKNMETLIQIVRKLRSFPKEDLAKLAKNILNTLEGIKRSESVEKFINGIKYIQKHSPHKDSMEILMNLEAIAENPREWDNVVTLSTIHSAKGLEGKNVAIINFNKIKDRDKDDDKNLAYVASSRAKHSLFLLTI